MIPIIFLTQFWIFAGLILATKQILNLKSNLKSFGIVFLSFLIIAFLSISFVIRMDVLPVNQIIKEFKKIFYLSSYSFVKKN